MKHPKKFWLVWSPTGQTPPKKLHDTHAEASAEAQRLAIAKPGQEFYVLKAKDRYKKYADVYEGLKDFLGDMYPAVIGKKPEAPKFPEYLKTKTATEVDQVNQEAMKVLDKMISDAMRAPATPALGKTIEKLNDVVQEALDKEITNLLKKNPLLTTGDAIKATKKQIEDALFFGVDYGKAGGDKTVFIINPAKLPEGKTLEQVIEGLANQYPGCEIMVGMMDEAGVFECVKALNPCKKPKPKMEMVKRHGLSENFWEQLDNSGIYPKGERAKPAQVAPGTDTHSPSFMCIDEIADYGDRMMGFMVDRFFSNEKPKQGLKDKQAEFTAACQKVADKAAPEVIAKQEAERVADLAKAGKPVKVVVEPTCQEKEGFYGRSYACDGKGGCTLCKADYQRLCSQFANWQG